MAAVEAAEETHRALVGTHRRGHQVDEHLGGQGVEAATATIGAARHAQLGDPQRTQGLVVLHHADELDQRAGAGHAGVPRGPPWRRAPASPPRAATRRQWRGGATDGSSGSSPWKSEPPVTTRPSVPRPLEVPRLLGLAVIGMVGLDARRGPRRAQASSRSSRRVTPGMRQRRHAAGGMDEGEDLLGRHARARHIRRAALAEQPVEGVLDRRRMPGVDQRLRHGRAAHRGARPGPTSRQQRRRDRWPRRRAPARRQSPAPAPRGGRAGRSRKARKGGVRRCRSSSRARAHRATRHTAVTSMPGTSVEPQPFGAGAALRAGRPRCRGRSRRRRRHAGGVHARDELRGAAPAVGRGRVQVQVDHVDGRSFAGHARPRPPSRRACAFGRACRRVMSARYSRISRSRCSRSSSANSRKICLPSESSNRSP